MNFVKLIPPELKIGNITAPQLKMREVSFSPTLFITKSNSENSSYKAIILFFVVFLFVLSLLGLGLIDILKSQNLSTSDMVTNLNFENFVNMFKEEELAQEIAEIDPNEGVNSDAEIEAEMENQQSENNSDPFKSNLISSLKDKNCRNYMPRGNDLAAVATFQKIFLSKINDELLPIITERMDNCFPFKAVTSDVISSINCKKNQCGVNDVTFYINIDGSIAVDYFVDGSCSYSKEDNFTNTSILCTRSN